MTVKLANRKNILDYPYFPTIGSHRKIPVPFPRSVAGTLREIEWHDDPDKSTPTPCSGRPRNSAL
jgi:hypothetical protein